MKILFAASEIFPYAKSGGLADVADSLPLALSEFETLFRVMPLYSFISKEELITAFTQSIKMGGSLYKLKFYKKSEDSLTTYFVEAPFLSETKNLYGDENGDYANNDIRFGLFCKAIVILAQKLKVDVVHLNDWHTALSALYIQEEKLKVQTLLTIHNLAYQGIFGMSSLKRLDISEKYFTMDGVEFYSKLNFLKAGIAYANKVTTVSPTYAKEILTPEFGCGLDGFLRYHKTKLSGILNGINAVVFNPKSDANLYVNYDFKNIKNKQEHKKVFLKSTKLKGQKSPLFVMVTRLVEQKGVDLLVESLEKLLAKRVNLFIVGEGSLKLVKVLERYSKEYKNFEFINAYNESLSHKVYGAADFLLMPSKFEPCGLNQMIAMRYGAIPIVHAVGGLKDSVKNDINGIVYKKQTQKALLQAVNKALKLQQNSKKFKEMIISNMKQDLSFRKSALAYLKLYKEDTK